MSDKKKTKQTIEKLPSQKEAKTDLDILGKALGTAEVLKILYRQFYPVINVKTDGSDIIFSNSVLGAIDMQDRTGKPLSDEEIANEYRSARHSIDLVRGVISKIAKHLPGQEAEKIETDLDNWY